MRLLGLICCIAALAACAPVQKKAEPPTPRTYQPAPKPRFDGLASLAVTSAPERDAIRERHRFDRAIKSTRIEGLRYYFYAPGTERSVVGFSFLNTGSPVVNPVGLRTPGARREYVFLFPDRARENIHLTVNDDVQLSGRISHDNMFRELHFFPRRQLPSLRHDESSGLLEVTLPTGEPVLFDPRTRELAGGVLQEDPIDFSRDRHQRRNPSVRYRGEFLVITVAQRGASPRRASVWGRRKLAEAHYPARYAKPCRLSPELIWDQRPKQGDSDPTLHMLHKTDERLFATIEQHCQWDLSPLRVGAPVLASASQ